MGRSITKKVYTEQKKSVEDALARAGIDKETVEIYILQFSVESTEHFDDSKLTAKLASLDVVVKVGKKLQADRQLHFVHDQVAHRLNGKIKERHGLFEVAFAVEGSYFGHHDEFRELIYVVVNKSVRPKDRVLQVKFIASPTSSFAPKLRNVRTVSTDLFLELNSEIQFRFDI